MEALSFWDVDSVLTFLAFSIYVEILNSLQGDEQHPSEKDATREKWRNGIIRRALLQSIWSKTNPCESLRSQSQPSKSIWGEPEQLKDMRSTYKCCPQVKSNPVHPRPPDRQQRISNSGGARPVTPQVNFPWTIEASWFWIHIVFADQESISKTRNSHTSLSRQPQPNQFCQVEVPLN